MSKARSNRTSPAAIALRKFFVSGFVVVSFAAYALHERLIQPDPASSATSPGNVVAPVQPIISAPQAASATPPISQQIVVASQRITSTPGSIVPTETQFIPSATLIPPSATLIPPTETPIPPTATTQPQGQYKDGVYAGPSVDAFYGMVQVQATVQNGKLIDVQFLDYPHDRRTSQQINSQAMPWLKQEAIQAQSAYVNIISGATLTSQAFAQSLYTALTQAAN